MMSGARTRDQLKSRLRALEARLNTIDEILRHPADGDCEEWAAERDDDDLLDRLARAAREEIFLIRVALHRIGRGDYGTCRECGKRIAQRRLHMLPRATKCVRCTNAA